MNRIKVKNLVLIVALIVTFIGCGSSSGSSSELTGKFIDGTVSGIKYVNGSNTGYTDANGNFPYSSGKVEFFIGNIKIGELNSLPSDGNVFIQDILGIDRTNTTDANLIKIATLLQSLDSDNTTDEIEIKQTDFDKFDAISDDIDNIDVTTTLTNAGFTVKNSADVKKHLDNMLKLFGIVTDTTTPELLTSSILDGAINVATNTNIVLTFTDDIQKSLALDSNNIVLKDANNNIVETDITYDFEIITLTPKSNLNNYTLYTLTIKTDLKDYGKNSLTNSGGNTNKVITFTTVDSNNPVFTSSNSVSVDENQIDALTVVATDESTITYSISGTDASSFNIDSSTGVITFKNAPDYEARTSYSITVTATDISSNSTTQNITITILDLDEVAPVLSSTTQTYITTVGTALTLQTVTASDTVDGVVTVVQSGDTVDFNTIGTYEVMYTATDSSSNSSSITHTYKVTALPSSIIHDGFTYNIITSPITGKKWLDRNLGATVVCTESRDSGSFSSDAEYVTSQEACFGDYYQWGRLTDGHEKKDSGTTTSRATDITSAGVDFITNSTSPYDWTQNTTQDTNNVDDDGSLRTIQWSKTDGTSICPVGFRVPTSTELYAETTYYSGTDDETTGAVKVTNRDTAFKNFLRFPAAGQSSRGGSLFFHGSRGIVWSSSVDSWTWSLYFYDSSAFGYSYDRVYGVSVRCVQDTNLNPTANAGEDKTVIDGTEISFDASASSDSDGTIASYEWKNGDTVLSTSSFFTKDDLAVGTHTITLIVTDNEGAKDFDQIEVEIVATSVSHDSFIYNTIASPITGKIWLDRNLGATAVCTESRDSGSFSSDAEYVTSQEACFGDYYQWGRLTDGHEKKDSGTTTSRATDITSAGVNFITNSTFPADWTQNTTQDSNNVDDDGSLRTIQWSKIDGTSICPIGFRVPTSIELYAETTQYSGTNNETTGAVRVTNRDTAFKNFLKFPASGYRSISNGSLNRQGNNGGVWPSSVDGSYSWLLYFYDSNAYRSNNNRAVGYSVRCIKD